MYFLGYDVGGSKIEAALFTTKPTNDAIQNIKFLRPNGAIGTMHLLAKARCPTDRHLGYTQIIDKLTKLANEVCAKFNITPSNLASIGLGVPGSVCPIKQVLLKGSIFALINQDILTDLSKALNFSSTIMCENDANCFALAESLGGAGFTHFERTQKPIAAQVSLGIILGTGVGGGLVVRGRLWSGVHGGAAEIGHTTLIPHGVACYCGKNGCAEMYLGGPALEAAFGQRRYSQIEGKIGSAEIFQLAQNFEPISIAVIGEYKRNLARFLGNIVSLLDLDFFVLGGGLSQQPSLYDNLEDLIAQNAFLTDVKVPVYQHRLGESAGVIGSALLAYEQHLSQKS